MGTKVDYKKDFKSLYVPKTTPEIINVPEMSFFTIEGSGSPDDPAFTEAVEALYALSYGVKMSYKSLDVPSGYYEYTVFPLEGIWDLLDKNIDVSVKSNYKYKLMIRQPDFLTPELFERFLTDARRKKPALPLDRVRMEHLKEGLCCQMMHLGSFAEEAASFVKMLAYCEAQGYQRIAWDHREIYLSDPRKTVAEKLKTVLRFKVASK